MFALTDKEALLSYEVPFVTVLDKIEEVTNLDFFQHSAPTTGSVAKKKQ